MSDIYFFIFCGEALQIEYLLYVKHYLSTIYTSHYSPKRFYYPYFIDEEMEAWRG